MGQNPVRTPDGLNRISGGVAADTPTPDLIVGSFPDSFLLPDVIGAGMAFPASAVDAPVGVAGFGFTQAEALAGLSLNPVPGFPVPVTPATIVGGSIVAVAPVGSTPGTILCQIDMGGTPTESIGVYTLSVTTAAGKTGGVRVQINPPN